MRLLCEPLWATFVPRFLFCPNPELFYKDRVARNSLRHSNCFRISTKPKQQSSRMRFSRVIAASLICTSFSICTNAFISCSPFASMRKMNSGRQYISKDSMFIGTGTTLRNKKSAARASVAPNHKISAALTTQSFSFNEFSHTLLSFEKNSLDFLRNSAKGIITSSKRFLS